MAYIDCDKCSHGSVCAYRHQYDDHIVTCSHWRPADDKAEIEELQSEIKILKDSNINLHELYQNEKEKVEKAKQKAIDIGRALKTAKAEATISFAKRLCDGRVSNDPVVIAAEALLKELTEEATYEIRKDLADL